MKSEKEYVPSKKILDKYADVLIRFGLNDGKGIKKGDVVFLQVPECAKPMLSALSNSVLRAGGNPIIQYIPDGISKDFFNLAGDKQLNFFPGKYLRGRIDEIDHSVSIEAEENPHELEKVDPKKIMQRSKSFRLYKEWRDEKENRKKFSWTLALYGTEAMAKEAGMTLKEYWGEIINACYLNDKNPVKKWGEIVKEINRVKDRLNNLKVRKLHVEAMGTDLIVGLDGNRKWLGGDGANIPSFEVFISPKSEETEGRIRFTEKLYRYGNLIEGVELEFKKGKVVKASAKKGEKVLKEMIATDSGSCKIGEFSLTDKRLSKINRFMATTLFDENVGGRYGNIHLALGNAYQSSYPGNVSKVSKGEWKKMQYNESVVHTDIVSTADKKVTAILENGEEKVIYMDGKFLI